MLAFAPSAGTRVFAPSHPALQQPYGAIMRPRSDMGGCRSARTSVAARAAVAEEAVAAAAHQASAAGADDGAAEPSWFSIDMVVRDYELDAYSVVNNAVYANYLQHCRHEFLLHVGLCPDTVARSGNALALSELNMRYLLPLRSGDHFRAACRVARATAARAVFEQRIWLRPRGGGPEQLALAAEAVVVCLDSTYKPRRIDADLRARLLAGAAAGGPPVPLQELL